MATFILIPGDGGQGRLYWREVAAELSARGHTAVPVEIAQDDPALGLPEFAAITDEAIGEHRDVVLVAQSAGGFIAPMVANRDAVVAIVLVNAMIPAPGETPGEWSQATRAADARRAANAAAGRPDELSLDEMFWHDVPDEAKADMTRESREPAATSFGQPCTFATWPDVPIHALVGADDRMFPAEFQRRVARERLGIEADVLPGGHLVAKSRPVEVAERLVVYALSASAPGSG